MDPVSITIITYVSLKFINKFIAEEGYGRIKKWLFPKNNYCKQLTKVIYETIDSYEKQFSYDTKGYKFPFYHSEIIFEELNNYILFKPLNSSEDVIRKLKTNTNIIIPSKEELSSFYNLFVEKINSDKSLSDLYIDENFKTKIFDIYKTVKNIENKIDTIDELLTFKPTNNWFTKQCNSSILDLGNRYTPEINFELEISSIFEGLGKTDVFKKKMTKKFDELLIKGKKVLDRKSETKELIVDLESHFDRMYELFMSIDFSDNLHIPIKSFNEALISISEILQKLDIYYRSEESKIQKEKNDYRFHYKYGSEIRNVREFGDEISSFDTLINGTICQLANNPFLILDGKAGIGKSHMLGDIISKRIRNKYESIFLLGQQFTTEEDPWHQILKKLHVTSKLNKFLAVINDRAKKSGKRIIFFIDAINEGRGIYFWNDNVRSFINDLKNYDWLGLVLTIRTSYKNLIFPKTEIESLKIIEHTIYGFINSEYEASKLFFNNYKIELPSVPLLNPEFQNPLFLKLFCEGISKSGLSKIPDGLQGITSIIIFFIKNVNEVLSQPKRLHYSKGVNLAIRSINAIIQYKIENELRHVSYEKAIEIVENSVSQFVTKKGIFLDELISEGIFSKNLFWKEDDVYEEVIYLAYERFEDHITCQYLLEKYSNVEDEFKDGGKLIQFVKDEDAIYINKGLVDAFTVQIPEKFNQELYEFIPQHKDKYPIVESFVESLLWRKFDTINEKAKDYVNNYVFSYEGTQDLFWETILSVTSIPEHYFNANSLHNHLIKFTLAERDSGWTQDLKYKYNNDSSVKRLIDWAWNENDKSYISDDSVKLSSIALAWFLTSTNRQLRDCSTKALVCLLQDRITVLIDVLKLFKNVNDPFVYERLFAVAYGCAVRTNQKENLAELSEYIYEVIFNEATEVYPHILLRDYARGVIEYTNHLQNELSFSICKVRPPYKSFWPESIPSDEELEGKYNNDDYHHLWSSVMSFGDFARYTIGTNHGNTQWSGCKLNETPVDREQLVDDFKFELSSAQLDLFNNLDPIITSDDGEELMFGKTKIKFGTAIGRKTEEKLSEIRKKFKESLSPEKLKYYEEQIEPFLDHNHKIINTGKHFDLRVAQRLIFSRTIELGWDPKLHLSFDKGIGTGRGRDSYPHERIGKKYQWIAYYEYMAKLSDNFIKHERWGAKKGLESPYQGPWDPYVRDIDPTMLISNTGYKEGKSANNWWEIRDIFNWDCSHKEWVDNSDDLPKFETQIQIKDPNDDDWLILEGHPGWAESKKIGEESWGNPHKSIWCQIRSYIVKEDDYNDLKIWLTKQDFMGRWMPESSEKYEVFSREYYWSVAHKYFKTEYYGGKEWREIHCEDSGDFITSVMLTTENFLWEEEFDRSKEETIRFLKPSQHIYEGMKLNYSKREGEFIDKEDETVCFAADVHYNSKSFLLVKKEPFLEYLQKNNFKIIWSLLGEKQIIGGRHTYKDFIGRLDVSGVYYLEDNQVVGDFKTKKIT